MNPEFLEYLSENLDIVNDDEYLCNYDIEEELKNEVDIRLIYSEQNYECVE